MSQYQNQDMYAYGDTGEGPRTSGMAIASLVLSLVGIIPCLGLITAPIGALLGLIGAVTIAPPKKGKGLALTGLVLGIVIFAAHAYAGKKVYDFFYGFFEVVERGPRTALTEGFAGNYGAFKADFYGAGATASDEEVKAFIDELRSRYGEFQASNLPKNSSQPMQPAPGQASIPFPYQLTFSNATVDAEAEIVFADPNAQQAGFINKLGYILVKDPDKGDLRYPPLAPATPPAPPAQAPGGGAAPGGDGNVGGGDDSGQP